MQDSAQEISAGSGGGLPSDLAILSVAANQLFESTRALDTEAVQDVLAGLATVSARAVPAAMLLPGPPKCACPAATACAHSLISPPFQTPWPLSSVCRTSRRAGRQRHLVWSPRLRNFQRDIDGVVLIALPRRAQASGCWYVDCVLFTF